MSSSLYTRKYLKICIQTRQRACRKTKLDSRNFCRYNLWGGSIKRKYCGNNLTGKQFEECLLHHISHADYVWTQQTFQPSFVTIDWGKRIEKITNGERSDEFCRIQLKLASIINKDVYEVDDMFRGDDPPKEEVADRLAL
jgi:hypothetical protein